MKTNILAIRFLLLAASVFFASCSDLSEDNAVVNPDATTSISLSSSDALVLSEDQEGQTALTINWTEPDFGFNGAVPTYNLVISVEGATEAVPRSIDVGNSLSKELLVEELNKAIIDAGALAGLEMK